MKRGWWPDAYESDGEGLDENSDPDFDNDGVVNSEDDFPYNAEAHSLKNEMQGVWQSPCLETEVAGSEMYQLEIVEFSNSELEIIHVFYSDPSCDTYISNSLSGSVIRYNGGAQYGDTIETTEASAAIEVELDATANARYVNLPKIPRQQLVSMEDDVLYFGVVNSISSEPYTLLRSKPYHGIDSSIGYSRHTAAPKVLTSTMDEDRTQPQHGLIFLSNSEPVKFNGLVLFSDIGDPPQRIDEEGISSRPGLRYGDFLVINNGWNAHTAGFANWYQDISFVQSENAFAVQFNWDWGSQADLLFGSHFSTRSFPQVIYGSKSREERSGTFQDTGLPAPLYQTPAITIDYDFDYEATESQSPNQTQPDSEFNVTIDSFYHSSCDIRRSGANTDNGVFELMVWLKKGAFLPSASAPAGQFTTSDGRTYDVYTRSYAHNFIAFVAETELQDAEVQYTELMRHAQANASSYGIYPLKNTDCLANIIIGTEIWHGAGTFNLNNFQITRRY